MQTLSLSKKQDVIPSHRSSSVQALKVKILYVKREKFRPEKQLLCIGIYFGFSMGLSTPLGYAYGDRNFSVCRVLEKYAYRFFSIAPIILYGCTYLLAPIGVRFFASPGSTVFDMAVSGLRLYGLGFLFSGINIFAAIRMMTYGKGYISGMITFLRSFALLLLFLTILPRFLELNGIWLAVPGAEILTLIVALWTLRKKL